MADIVAAGIRQGAFPVGGDEGALPQFIELQAVEGALDAVSFDLAHTQGSTAMGALVHHAAEFPTAVSK